MISCFVQSKKPQLSVITCCKICDIINLRLFLSLCLLEPRMLNLMYQLVHLIRHAIQCISILFNQYIFHVKGLEGKPYSSYPFYICMISSYFKVHWNHVDFRGNGCLIDLFRLFIYLLGFPQFRELIPHT